MTQPRVRSDGSWLPAATVLRHLGTPAGTDNAADVERARLAAASYVERLRPDLLTVTSTATGDVVTFDASPDVVEAGVLVAARLYSRKGSPAGVASFGEFGPAAVLRFDPDVERLLELGRHARPRVG